MNISRLLAKIISPVQILSTRKLVPLFFIFIGLVSSCSTVPPSTPTVGKDETPQTDVTDVFTPTPQVLESSPTRTSMNDTAGLFSSDQLGLCFFYPQGYTQNPDNDTAGISAPNLPGSAEKGVFWLEISNSYNRTVEKIADEDMTYAVAQQGVPLENLGRWTETVGGEQAVVLDGMPGQDLQRRVYIVHQETLYVLAFSPTRSENKAAGDQMEALYAEETSSWAWSPCSASE